MTRVERINKAIEILHVNRGMNVSQIQSLLQERWNIYLEQETIASVLLDLRYRPLCDERRQTEQERQREKLNKLLVQLVRPLAEHGASYKHLVCLLNQVGIPVPGSGLEWNLNRLKKYLIRWNLYQRTGLKGSKCTMTFRRYFAIIEDVIPQLEELSQWAKSRSL